MAEQLSRLLRGYTHEGRTSVMFWCPGCDSPHSVRVGGGGEWGYNNNPDAPTFTPSVLVTGGGDGKVCHSFVTDGRIQFLSDCSHALAGQTVPLAEWPTEFDSGERIDLGDGV